MLVNYENDIGQADRCISTIIEKNVKNDWTEENV